MNKKMMAVLLISMSIFAAGCGANQGKTQAVNNSQSSNTSTSSTSSTNSTSTQNAGEKTSSYDSYSGSWLTEKSVKQDYKYGMGMTIDVDKDGNLKGQIGNASDNASHVANVDIKGKIENNKLSYNFSEDGWEHSGTINLQFSGSKITAVIKYKSSGQNNLWGIGEGTFTLVKNDSKADTTLSDLKDGGLQVIDDQCFNVSLNSFGKVRFVSGWKREDGKQQLYFYLVGSTGKVIYKFPDFCGNEKGTFSEIKAVSFSDANNDGQKDIIIITGYKTDLASSEEKTISSIYFEKSKEFKSNTDFDNKLNNSSSNKSIASILKYAKQNLNK